MSETRIMATMRFHPQTIDFLKKESVNYNLSQAKIIEFALGKAFENFKFEDKTTTKRMNKTKITRRKTTRKTKRKMGVVNV